MIVRSHRIQFLWLFASSFVAVMIPFSPALFSNPPTSEKVDEAAAIHKVIEMQSDAWNRGDIDAFMIGYWNDPRLTFSSGGSVERGWTATRDRYKSRYPDKATMGKLTFSKLETRILNDRAAMTLGEWRLERNDPIGGNFTLVWERFDDGWKIIHDHTSIKNSKPAN